MEAADNKKFTAQAKAAIKGEAFFETLVSDYAVPHHIVGPKDLGIDYICEWVFGDRPTGILYAVQVKTLSAQYAQPVALGVNERFNELRRFKIPNPHLHIDERTLQYWRGLGIPVYLFAIIYSAPAGHGARLDCYYKRFTRVLTTAWGQEHEDFYQVNDGATFLAFADQQARRFGFARDLFIDLMRCAYHKGSIAYISPRTMGLEQFPEEDAVFGDLFEEYRDAVFRTYRQTRYFLERIWNDQGEPSAEAPDEESGGADVAV